jgi:hypothetical protein
MAVPQPLPLQPSNWLFAILDPLDDQKTRSSWPAKNAALNDQNLDPSPSNPHPELVEGLSLSKGEGRQETAIRPQRDAERTRRRPILRQAQDEVRQAQDEVRQAQDEVRQAQNDGAGST